ncbi:MAG: KTSC domain-containing protein [Verrucomicrobiota bacterium]|nr:KTSC domain-containing protein [Verrucomicrobiota bacterium]
MRARRWLWIAPAFLFFFSVQAADRSVEPIKSRIQREAVESSALSAVGYSRRLHALEIEFRDGLIYRYLEVPASTHRALMSAESKARFYNKQVRGKYRCLRVRSKRTG